MEAATKICPCCQRINSTVEEVCVGCGAPLGDVAAADGNAGLSAFGMDPRILKTESDAKPLDRAVDATVAARSYGSKASSPQTDGRDLVSDAGPADSGATERVGVFSGFSAHGASAPKKPWEKAEVRTEAP